MPQARRCDEALGLLRCQRTAKQERPVVFHHTPGTSLAEASLRCRLTGKQLVPPLPAHDYCGDTAS